MTRTWEQALEMELPDSEQSSDSMRKESELHQPPSPSNRGSRRSQSTILESYGSTDSEAGGPGTEGPTILQTSGRTGPKVKVGTLAPTIPKGCCPTKPEAPPQSRADIYPSRLLPASLREQSCRSSPRIPKNSEWKNMGHITSWAVDGGEWRMISKRLFEKTRRESGHYFLLPELRREVLRCRRHLGHKPKSHLARVLADAGAKPEVIDWTKRHVDCPVCKATITPGLLRPAAARKADQLKKTVGADHCTHTHTHTFASHQFDFLNVLRWGPGKWW